MKKQNYPDYIARYFWGDNLEELDFDKHHTYMVQTILDRGDSKSVKWLFNLTGRENIKQLLPKLKMSKKSTNFWSNYL